MKYSPLNLLDSKGLHDSHLNKSSLSQIKAVASEGGARVKFVERKEGSGVDHGAERIWESGVN